MVGFRGFELKEVGAPIIDQITSGHLGGVILFDYDVVKKKAARNIKSPDQVRQLITDLKDKAEIPLFVAVDQEGGKVNRLKTKYGFPATVSAKYLGDIDNIDSTKYYALKSAKNLKSLGFNVNFAPVVDVDLNPDNPVIGKIERSFSKKAEQVVKHGKAYVEMQDSMGIISTLKHFPGHGSAAADSHKGVTDITDYWKREEYLQMKAVNAIYPFETIVEKAIEAGVDILVIGNNLEYDELVAEKVIKIICKLVEEGTISRERIQASYDRIMRVKNWELGIKS